MSRRKLLKRSGTAAMALCALALSAVSGGEGEVSAGTGPELILDESAPRWRVDRFAGNSTAGSILFQGPAREAGGLTRCAVTPAPDGSVFMASGAKWAHDRIVRVTPGGELRLIAGGGSSLEDGPASRAKILVATRGNSLVYSPSDESLYFVHTMIPAVRRLYRKEGAWHVETVAGSPQQAGHADGPAAEARFTEPMSLAVTSSGTVYVLDDRFRLREIENETVTTLATFRGGPRPVDGPLDQSPMAITDMSGHITLGENDHTLYVADHWHFAARRIDLKSGRVTTVAGVSRGHARFGKHADGSALTQASFVSGCAYVKWDPYHRALWCGGPDEHRFRWLKDGRVTTVIGRRGNRRWPVDQIGVPSGEVMMVWSHVAAVDDRGGVYLVSASHHGVWRASEQKEGDR
jgi:hypothetical protein